MKEPIEVDIQTDEYGNWSTEVLNTLDPGVHTAVLQTSSGEEQDVAFFVLQDDPNLIQQVQSAVPPMFNAIILILLLLVIGLAANTVRLARKADKTTSDKKNMKYTKGAIAVSVVAILIALISGILVNKESGVLDGVFNNQEAGPVNVSGTVVDPLTEAGVAEVDLTVGKTSVHTSTSGNYTFSSIAKDEGIKITHPKLIRSLRYEIQDGANQTIYFNYEMYNLIVNVVNNEARQQFADNYDYVHDELKNRVGVGEYADRESIFGLDDLVDQELGISSVQVISSWTNEMYTVQFDNVVEIEVVDDGSSQNFYLIYSDDSWWLVN